MFWILFFDRLEIFAVITWGIALFSSGFVVLEWIISAKHKNIIFQILSGLAILSMMVIGAMAIYAGSFNLLQLVSVDSIVLITIYVSSFLSMIFFSGKVLLFKKYESMRFIIEAGKWEFLKFLYAGIRILPYVIAFGLVLKVFLFFN